MAYAGQIPLLIGFCLALLGAAFGSRFISAAKAQVGGRFGVSYLPGDHWLTQRVARLARQLNMPTPAVGVINVTNAFAIGSKADAAVVIGTPLIKTLTPEELDAVIGHELGHIASNDMQRMQFAEGFQAMLGKVIGGTVSILVQAWAKKREDAQLGLALGDLLRATVFVGSELVVKGISRSREFYADAIGASLTSPDAMIGALERIHGIPAKPTRLENHYGYLMFRAPRLGAVFSTHPSLDKRTKALRAGTHLALLPRKIA